MDIKLLSIDSIGLSVRSLNALHNVNVHTVGEMLGYTEESLSQIKNLGKKSVKEVLVKIKQYKQLDAKNEVKGMNDEAEVIIPENFDEWITVEGNRNIVVKWLTDKQIRIEALELLSARAFNILMFAGYDYLYQIAFLSIEELMNIQLMDEMSAHDIEKLTMRFIHESKEEIFHFISDKKNIETFIVPPVVEMLSKQEYRDMILQYVKANDVEIRMMGLTIRAENRLLENGYWNLSDIIFKSRAEFLKIPSMGKNSVDDIIQNINSYLTRNESRIIAFVSGDESALWDDEEIKKMILNLYSELGFSGLTFNEILEELELPEQVTQERVKHIIGMLIADKQLEYVDYHCYRVYDRFEDALEKFDINARSIELIRRRLRGDTLDAIGKDYNLTRERVRQIVKIDINKLRKQYVSDTGMKFFDEDYYKHLYENYQFDKKDGTEWLGIPLYVWNYLELMNVKQGKENLQSALDDHDGLDLGLRLKIKNYLNRNKLFVDGMWVDKNRSALEEVVARKFCQNDVSYKEFCDIYNQFLQDEEIPYDEKIYYTEAVYRTRKNRLAAARFVLWKQNEQIRFYDIDGQDYTELLEELNLASYENIELSTVKFMRDHPDIMTKYDIRNQYELHNLLRKIVPEGSYHDFHCGRTPEIKFGQFDRDAAILDILVDNAPINTNDLAELISKEYGYEPSNIMGTYLKNFSEYCYRGIYSIDQKQMSNENKEMLQDALTKDFYYIDEIRYVYKNLIPNADTEEINSYNLKNMGFQVYSGYVVQNYPTLEEYFIDLLTREDIVDLTEYRKRFVYIQLFSQKLMELKKSLQVIEFEPNVIINIRKLKQEGITLEIIQEYCDAVYDFVDDGEYFSSQSLRKAGFKTELYDLGFSDWFYGNLLISDNRFSYGTMFGSLILFKGKENITIKSFEMNRIQEYGCIDALDLMNELIDKYGCRISDKSNMLYKLHGTEVYYNEFLDRLYVNKDAYYHELENGGF